MTIKRYTDYISLQEKYDVEDQEVVLEFFYDEESMINEDTLTEASDYRDAKRKLDAAHSNAYDSMVKKHNSEFASKHKVDIKPGHSIHPGPSTYGDMAHAKALAQRVGGKKAMAAMGELKQKLNTDHKTLMSGYKKDLADLKAKHGK